MHRDFVEKEVYCITPSPNVHGHGQVGGRIMQYLKILIYMNKLFTLNQVFDTILLMLYE